MALTPIPKIIHFVWAGGGMIPFERQAYIMTWTKYNPSWQVRVWYDSNNFLTDTRNKLVKQRWGQLYLEKDKEKVRVLPKVWKRVAKKVAAGGDESTIDYLHRTFGVSEMSLRQERMDTFEALLDFCWKNRIGLFDINDLGHFPTRPITALYHQEMAGNSCMGTNYGSTSDMLRLLILLEYGGLYLDSDVFCILSLDDIKAHPESPRYGVTHYLLPECLGKNAPGLKPHQWDDPEFWRSRFVKVSQTPQITNSIIAAHPKSEGLRAYKRLIVSNYGSRAPVDLNQYVGPETFRSETIQLTGPTAANQASGYKAKSKGVQDQFFEKTMPPKPAQEVKEAEAEFLKKLLKFRDNVYFPMYHVVDVYGHEWLKN